MRFLLIGWSGLYALARELASLRFAPEADVFNASTDVRQVPTTSLRVTLTTLVSATSHFEFIDHPVGATQTTT